MVDISSLNIAQGHSKLPKQHEYALARWILTIPFGDVRFHLGYVGGSAHLKIMRSLFFGTYETTWEAIGPAGSIHRLPNGATVCIGRQESSPHNEVPVTEITLRGAPLMWRDISLESEEAAM